MMSGKSPTFPSRPRGTAPPIPLWSSPGPRGLGEGVVSGRALLQFESAWFWGPLAVADDGVVSLRKPGGLRRATHTIESFDRQMPDTRSHVCRRRKAEQKRPIPSSTGTSLEGKHAVVVVWTWREGETTTLLCQFQCHSLAAVRRSARRSGPGRQAGRQLTSDFSRWPHRKV